MEAQQPVKCPKCGAEFVLGRRKVKSLRNELQHHLYMSHRLDVIESHKIAEALTAALTPRVWKKKSAR